MADVSPRPVKRRKLNRDHMSPTSRVMDCSNHFDVLELVAPTLDELNRVIWTTQKTQIKKQYFKISRQVHPDRHVGDEKQSKRAAKSFDLVQRSFETLNDNVKREQYVTEYGEKLKYERSKTKFDVVGNDSDNSKRLSLEKQNQQLEESQTKRLKRKRLIEKEANEFEQNILNEFNEKRKNIEMKIIRSKQAKKSLQRHKDGSSDHDTSGSDEDIDIEKTLSKLKNKQRKNKRRFR
eukprot:314547_1